MKRLLYVLIPAVLLGGLIAWRFHQKTTDKQQQDKAAAARKTAAPSVNVSTATVRDIVHTFEGVGSVEAPFNVKISSKVTGLIQYLQVREGDAVRVGDVIARIDPSAVQALVAQQEAAVAEAQNRLSQATITANSNDVNVESQVRTQQAALETAKSNYDQVKGNYDAQVATAQSAVTDAEGKVASAKATIANADATIRSAQANVKNAQVRYDRTNNLYKQGFVAAQDVDDARTTVNVQVAALNVNESQRDAAKSALDSANAQLESARQNVSIVTKKGKADIEVATSAIKQAQAALSYARANTAQKPAYQANLAALRSAVTAAQAQLRNAQSQLNDTILRSTINGFVTNRYADPGTVMTASAPIIAIQSEKQVYVTVPIPEDVSRHVKIGETATSVFDALPGQRFEGRIERLDPAADPQSRQFTMRVTLANPLNLVKPGMFGRTTFETDRVRGAVVVPREAVQTGKNGQQTVTVIDPNGNAHVRTVQIGAQDEPGIQIVNGVQAGEQVVILTLNPIKDGKKVKVAPNTPPGGAAPADGAPAAGRRGTKPASL
ncbi:MAG: family efflux transporter subunit [Chthonomonadaceae bacterium]|nr:family efflux transporter subunit [Chthonomonadaceae bacterium]